LGVETNQRRLYHRIRPSGYTGKLCIGKGGKLADKPLTNLYEKIRSPLAMTCSKGKGAIRVQTLEGGSRLEAQTEGPSPPPNHWQLQSSCMGPRHVNCTSQGIERPKGKGSKLQGKVILSERAIRVVRGHLPRPPLTWAPTGERGERFKSKTLPKKKTMSHI